jgi:CTP:molybdopterin cytidylyltransferase MocA
MDRLVVVTDPVGAEAVLDVDTPDDLEQARHRLGG